MKAGAAAAQPHTRPYVRRRALVYVRPPTGDLTRFGGFSHRGRTVIPSIPNLRDLGGHRTADGAVVRRGLAYRADQLIPDDADDLEALARLGLRHVIDLRSQEERLARPDHPLPGVESQAFDVLADANMSGLAGLEALLRDPERANEVLGDGRVDLAFADVYRGFVSLASARRAYREVFLALGRPDRLPVLFHCATGKDRTGWASAVFLTFLGVPPDIVLADYLRSNDHILPRYAPMIETFVAAGGERAILTAVFGVRRQHLEAAFAELTHQYGTVDQYLDRGLGIDQMAQASLRALYLERA